MGITATFAGTVHYASASYTIGAIGSTIYISPDRGRTWPRCVRLPLSPIERLAACARLPRRLFRTGVHAAALNSRRQLLVLCSKYTYSIDIETGRSRRSASPICGSRPLNVSVGPDGQSFYFGEYRSNAAREPVRVFRSDDGGLSWKIIYELAGVRHFHGVHWDPVWRTFLLFTGDSDEECWIWRATENFSRVERLAGGNQMFRIVTPLLLEDAIVFGTDSPEGENAVYRLDRNTLSVERLATLDGPAFWAAKLGSGCLCVTTVCEPGAGSKRRRATLWISPDGHTWRECWSAHKDSWPLRLFQYGQLKVVAEDGASDHFWIVPFATRFDQHSFRLCSGNL